MEVFYILLGSVAFTTGQNCVVDNFSVESNFDINKVSAKQQCLDLSQWTSDSRGVVFLLKGCSVWDNKYNIGLYRIL